MTVHGVSLPSTPWARAQRLDELRWLQEKGHELTAREQCELDSLVAKAREEADGERDRESGRLVRLTLGESVGEPVGEALGHDWRQAEGQGALGG